MSSISFNEMSNAVHAYREEQDDVKRNDLYETTLYPLLQQIAKQVVSKFSFGYENQLELIDECVREMTMSIPKIKDTKSSVKWFTTVARFYLSNIHQREGRRKDQSLDELQKYPDAFEIMLFKALELIEDSKDEDEELTLSLIGEYQEFDEWFLTHYTKKTPAQICLMDAAKHLFDDSRQFVYFKHQVSLAKSLLGNQSLTVSQAFKYLLEEYNRWKDKNVMWSISSKRWGGSTTHPLKEMGLPEFKSDI